jgi:hypothetical protein
MADSADQRGPGRPRKPEKFPPVALQLPPGHYEYLQYLVRVSGRLGDSENEAARFILIRELDKMMRGRYHERGTPSE